MVDVLGARPVALQSRFCFQQQKQSFTTVVRCAQGGLFLRQKLLDCMGFTLQNSAFAGAGCVLNSCCEQIGCAL
jgi:hypothetical protein